MQIRDKLTFLFLLIVALIMGISSLAIYYLSAQYRREEFYDRISKKANNVAKLLIEVEEVDITLLSKLEENNPVRLPEEEILIFDNTDSILYKSEEPLKWIADSALLNKIQSEEELRFILNGKEMLGFLFADQHDRVIVIAGAKDIYGFRKMDNLRNVLIIVFGSALLFTFISGRIYASRMLAPISKVISQVDAIGITNLGNRVDEGNQKDEIAKLARTFNQMLSRLEDAFKLHKNFITNASHELRTPLTAITGRLEITLQKPRTDEEYRRTIDSVLEEMKNLNYLSNRLLLIAQASSENVQSSFTEVRVDELVWQSAAELQKRNPDYKIMVTFDENLEERNLIVKGSEQLIKSAILNLMDNGCKYSDPPKVQVTVTPEGSQLRLEFIDKGIGIDEQDISLIFQPFHRGLNVANIKGHGIGLPLVQSIVHLHRGSLTLSSKKGQGTTFRLSFPTFSQL